MSQPLTRVEENHEVLQSGSRLQGRGSKPKRVNTKEEWWLLISDVWWCGYSTVMFGDVASQQWCLVMWLLNSDIWWCGKLRRLEIRHCAEGACMEAGGKPHGLWSEVVGQCWTVLTAKIEGWWSSRQVWEYSYPCWESNPCNLAVMQLQLSVLVWTVGLSVISATTAGSIAK